MLWPHILSIAILSDTLSIPQSDIGNSSGLQYLISATGALFQEACLRCRLRTLTCQKKDPILLGFTIPREVSCACHTFTANLKRLWEGPPERTPHPSTL